MRRSRRAGAETSSVTIRSIEATWHFRLPSHLLIKCGMIVTETSSRRWLLSSASPSGRTLLCQQSTLSCSITFTVANLRDTNGLRRIQTRRNRQSRQESVLKLQRGTTHPLEKAICGTRGYRCAAILQKLVQMDFGCGQWIFANRGDVSLPLAAACCHRPFAIIEHRDKDGFVELAGSRYALRNPLRGRNAHRISDLPPTAPAMPLIAHSGRDCPVLVESLQAFRVPDLR